MQSYPVEHRECRITAILILFGLPRLLTGSILAHECMHAYLKLCTDTKLSPTVEEGLCQLMAYLWIERQQPEVHNTPDVTPVLFSISRIRMRGVWQASLPIRSVYIPLLYMEMASEWPCLLFNATAFLI